MASPLDRLVGQPQVYNTIQRFLGLAVTRRRMAPLLNSAAGGSILDVGGGTGLLRSLVPASARYNLLDLDPLKLRGFAAAHPGEQALRGDATQLGLRDKSFDAALCVSVAHHLTNAQLAAALSELARIIRARLIFVDALIRPDSVVSNWLWRYDRGSHPRTAEALTANLEAYFTCERAERYAIYHEYLLWIGTPRTAGEEPSRG